MTPSQARALQSVRQQLPQNWGASLTAQSRQPIVPAREKPRTGNGPADRLLDVLERMGRAGERIRTLAQLAEPAGIAVQNPSASVAAALTTLRGRGEIDVALNEDATRTYRIVRSGVEVRTE